MMRRSCILFAMGAFAAAGAVLPMSLSACGTDVDSEFADPSGPETGTTGDQDGNTFAPNPMQEASTPCTTGKKCGDGGVCAGNTCCTAKSACGDVCCAGTEVCSFQKCAVPGAVCHDSSECTGGQYCEFTLGTATDGGTMDSGNPDASCVSGVERTGRCLPKPPDCAPDAGSASDAGITCLEKCEYRPATTFTPAQKFAWGGQVVAPYATDVMMAPIVIELDDDDCDGKVTERDIPEVVFSTFTSGNYGAGNGVGAQLHAISIVGGAFVDKWTVPNTVNATIVNPTKQIAAGNFDGKPGNEVVACGIDGKLHAFKGTDGSELWASPVLPLPPGATLPADANKALCMMPAIADLDGDGTVEVIVEGAILNGADGTIKHLFVPAINGPFVVSDLDSDGKLDIITSSRGYHADGIQFVDTNIATTGSFPGTQDWKGAWAGVGDFNNDGKPEVVVVDNDTHSLMMWRYDAAAANKFTVVRGLTDMNALFGANACPVGTWGNLHGGGPPTIADFDRDGTPDVGLAGGIGYVVFDGKKLVNPAVTGVNSILWSKPTVDCSSASTGSTVFDFDGDGKAEVVYSDEHRMRIYEGATGNELASFCNTTATLIEFPIVADVDNDGHADIIVASNAYGEVCNDGVTDTRQAGIRVFGAATGTWVRTRRVWNEHSYHITNVNEDGTIPKNELSNWKQPGLNNFRQNKQPGSEFAAPNVVASAAPLCPGPTGVLVTVRNIGEALVPAGVVVGVYGGMPPSGSKLGTVTTTRALYPAESEPLELTVTAVPGTVYTVVDDGAPPHPAWHECRTDDNVSKATSTSCNEPH